MRALFPCHPVPRSCRLKMRSCYSNGDVAALGRGVTLKRFHCRLHQDGSSPHVVKA